jgi:hypothetical protein
MPRAEAYVEGVYEGSGVDFEAKAKGEREKARWSYETALPLGSRLTKGAAWPSCLLDSSPATAGS